MSAPPVDTAVLTDLQDSMGANFAAELVATFLQEAPGMIADLRAAAAEGAADDLRRAAHSIKSNAAIFGAEPLADIAREIEIEGLRDGALARLEAEYARAAEALKDAADG
ncbi:Hpt domain-containing protein [Ruegeria marina]|uniref:Hpt domain-containing protein n=1 Tax=Ruegeria marina TaxID=639004 RepID=A0A1G7FE57_9RHOB|nr:Hpt domain-containing protein [Ruegeria marina]SDE74154.1 Hpt domain-containing protein [Ruegeria marina]